MSNTSNIEQTPAPKTNGVAVLLGRALRWGMLFNLVLLLIGGLIGYLVAGSEGMWGAVLGALIGALFMSMSALSILFANRFSKSELFAPVFFAIVLGGWILKFAVFIVLALYLRDQPWLDPTVLFLTLIVTVIASLVIDVVVLARTRVPTVEVTLPLSTE